MGGLARWLHSPSVQHQRRYWRQHDVNLAGAWARRVAARREAATESKPADVIVLPDVADATTAAEREPGETAVIPAPRGASS